MNKLTLSALALTAIALTACQSTSNQTRGVGGANPASAHVSDFATAQKNYLAIEKTQIEKNQKEGNRFVPEKILPVPKNVSIELAKAIQAPYNSPRWYANHADTPDEWHK